MENNPHIEVASDGRRFYEDNSLIKKCNENPWLRDDAEYPLYDYDYCFLIIDSAEELKNKFEQGNWSIRTGYIYGENLDLAFVQQVNGGDEWLALKKENGEWESFESISFYTIIKRDGDERFYNYLERLSKQSIDGYWSNDENENVVQNEESQEVDILEQDFKKFNHMLLGRMEQDCKYFLGYGNANEKHLWAGDVEKQIAYMKSLWNSLDQDNKPDWLSLDDIGDYKKSMYQLAGVSLDKPEIVYKFERNEIRFDPIDNTDLVNKPNDNGLGMNL